MAGPEALLSSLRSSEPQIRAAALERAVLRALAWDLDELPIRRLGQCYRELSASILAASAEGGLPTGELGHLSEREAAVIWSLVYGLRSFHVADRLLGPMPDSASGLTEVGGGWGPIALWSAVRGGNVRVVEQAAARRSFGEALFASLGLQADWLGAWRGPEDLGRRKLAVWSFSLREMAGDPRVARTLLLESLEHLGSQGRILVLESGARAGSEFLMEVRDLVMESGVEVSAPCVAKGPCPMRAAGDWCHFTWRFGLGPIGQRIAAVAGRRAHEVHVSWLMLRPAASQARDDADGGRVLTVRSLGKQGFRLNLCRSEGMQTVDVPRKVARIHPAFEMDLVGAMVSVASREVSVRVRKVEDLEVEAGADVSHET